MAKKILTIEDDRDLLTLVDKKLTDEGFEVVGFETGQQALDYLKNHRPDLIVLDILLPDIDGITVLTEITNNENWKDIPVIIFSNLDQPGSFEQVTALGDYEYLVKAKTELSDLADKIKKKLGLE